MKYQIFFSGKNYFKRSAEILPSVLSVNMTKLSDKMYIRVQIHLMTSCPFTALNPPVLPSTILTKVVLL